MNQQIYNMNKLILCLFKDNQEFFFQDHLPLYQEVVVNHQSLQYKITPNNNKIIKK